MKGGVHNKVKVSATSFALSDRIDDLYRYGLWGSRRNLRSPDRDQLSLDERAPLFAQSTDLVACKYGLHTLPLGC